MNVDTRLCRRIAAKIAMPLYLLFLVFLAGSGCTRQLRDGVVSGAASFVADATYGILAELLPFPLVDVSNGGGGEDPFSDEPLQM